MIMPESVIYKFTTDYGYHAISLDSAKKLPYKLADPVMIFKGSIPNSLVAITEILDKNVDTVIVAIHLNKKEKRMIVNRIASVYGKYNIENYVINGIENGNLTYASKEKAPNWFTNRGLQLPKLVQTMLSASTDSITTSSENINSFEEKIQKFCVRPPVKTATMQMTSL